MAKSNVYECLTCELEFTSRKKFHNHLVEEHDATIFKQDGELKIFMPY